MKAVFTICSPSHLAYSLTLIESVHEHNIDINPFICVFDINAEAIGNLPANKTYTLIDVEQLQISCYDEIKKRYNPFELSCALKPYLAEYIFRHYEIDQLIYFDSDIFVTASLENVYNYLSQHDILLTPHFTKNLNAGANGIEYQSQKLIESIVLRAGIFNGGFFCLKKSDNTDSFLAWWKDVLLKGCYNDFNRGLFTDQLWLNIVPLLFHEYLYILRGIGYNMAYWNLYERKLSYNNNRFFVNDDQPLVFYHFSGYNLHSTTYLTVYPCLYTFEDRKEMTGLFEIYKSRLIKNGLLFYQKFKQKKRTNSIKATLSRIKHYLIRKLQALPI